MSIASEMTNLAANRDAIKAAIEAKNPSVAPTDALSSFPAAIASIPTGGGGGASTPWPSSLGWPDIKALLNADTEDYAHKAYFLFDALAFPSVIQLCVSHDLALVRPCEKAVTSDGQTYTPSSPDHTHVWDTSRLIGGRYGWVALYSSTKFKSLNVIQSYSSSSNSIPRVLWVVGNTGVDVPDAYGFVISAGYCKTRAIDFKDGISYGKASASRMFFSATCLLGINSLDLSACTDVNNAFAENYSLTAVPSILDISRATNANALFVRCSALAKVPDVLDFSSCTNVSSVFRDCVSLTAVPDVLDFSSVTSASNLAYAFGGCRSLRALPTHVAVNYSLSFSDCTGVTNKDSVCTFSNGVVSGGFVGNLNTCPNNGQTITLNSYIKGLFTSSEQSAIEAAMKEKHWTLSW